MGIDVGMSRSGYEKSLLTGALEGRFDGQNVRHAAKSNLESHRPSLFTVGAMTGYPCSGRARARGPGPALAGCASPPIAGLA